MNQICKNLFLNKTDFMFSIFFSGNSIAGLFFPIHALSIFAWKSSIGSMKIVCGFCPHPASGIRPVFS